MARASNEVRREMTFRALVNIHGRADEIESSVLSLDCKSSKFLTSKIMGFLPPREGEGKRIDCSREILL